MRAKKGQFDFSKNKLKRDLQNFQNKTGKKTDNELRAFEKDLANLSKILVEMEGTFNKDKDSKEKKQIIRECKSQYEQLFALMNKIKNKMFQDDQSKLFQGAKAQNPHTKMTNQDLMQENLQGVGWVVKTGNEINTNLDNINAALIDDDETLQNIRNMNEDIMDDTNATKTLMKRQKNQELLKRLTLVGLAAFLTLSDIVLLILKVT